jgi:hypothetical protein
MKAFNFIIFVHFISAYDIKCLYRTDVSWGFGCDVKFININFVKDCTLNNVTGLLNHNKTKDDVKFLNVTSKQLRYFPTGMAYVFKNIEILHVSCPKIRHISRDDLRPFGKRLKHLALPRSAIASIGNVFESTPNVEYFHIESLNMENVDYQTFETIRDKLNTLIVNFPCTGYQLLDEKREILHLIDGMKSSCFHEMYRATIFVGCKNFSNRIVLNMSISLIFVLFHILFTSLKNLFLKF